MSARKPWTEKEDSKLFKLVKTYGSQGEWETIASHMPERTDEGCRYRWKRLNGYWTSPTGKTPPRTPKSKASPRKVSNSKKWSAKDDEILRKRVVQYYGDWDIIASGLRGHNESECRTRWNQLKPKGRDKYSVEEDRMIVDFVAEHGTKWADLSELLDKRRSSIDLRNRWYAGMRTLARLLAERDEVDEEEIAIYRDDNKDRRLHPGIDREFAVSALRHELVLLDEDETGAYKKAAASKPEENDASEAETDTEEETPKKPSAKRQPNSYPKKAPSKNEWSREEDERLIEFLATEGTQWRKIAPSFPGRTHEDLKQHWYVGMRRYGRLLARRDGVKKSPIHFYDRESLLNPDLDKNELIAVLRNEFDRADFERAATPARKVAKRKQAPSTEVAAKRQKTVKKRGNDLPSPAELAPAEDEGWMSRLWNFFGFNS